MSNLTFDRGVIKQHPPEPLEGFTVVVFERVGTAGEVARSEIAPGGAAPSTRLSLKERVSGRPKPQYFAFAVNRAHVLRDDFTERVVLDDRAFDFDLTVAVAFSVSNATALATQRNDDPVRRLREEATHALGDEVRQLPWDVVTQRFTAAARRIVDEQLPALQHHASSYGISLHGIVLARRLPERVVEPDHAIDTETRKHAVKVKGIQLETSKREVELEMKQRLAAREAEAVRADGQLHVLKTGYDTLANSLRTVGGNISSANDLRDAIGMLQSAGTSDPGGLRHLAGTPAFGALGAGTEASGDRLAELLQQMILVTGPIASQRTGRALRAAILRLVAELLDDANDATLRTHADRVVDIVANAQLGHAHEQFDFVGKLSDVASLRQWLT